MNTQEYISSGIIEIYVLGLASPEEAAEFERMCRLYPEVLQARIDFEELMEKKAIENAIAPPQGLKEKILENIHTESKPLPLQQAPVRKLTWLKYAAAACVVLLAGSIYLNISLSNRNKKLKTDYDNTLTELNLAKEDIQKLTIAPQMKMAMMKGTPASPQSFATVYWDTTSHDVYLMINNLPAPASDKQYQLWALLDGTPIDMGLIDNKYFIEQKNLLIKGKNLQNAQAFAITLEQIGRTDISKPGGAVYVVGNL